MKLVIQRVSEASVTVEGKTVGKIGPGLLVLCGAHKSDDQSVVDWITQKLIHLRIFADEEQKMNHSVQDINGGILIISQFTLYSDCSKGRRPSFIEAAPEEIARPLYDDFLASVQKHHPNVEAGIFGADMKVSLINDGPVTLIIEKMSH